MPQFWQKKEKNSKTALSAINSTQCVGPQTSPAWRSEPGGSGGGRSLRGERRAPGQQLATPRCRQVPGQRQHGQDQNAEAAMHRSVVAFANNALGLS